MHICVHQPRRSTHDRAFDQRSAPRDSASYQRKARFERLPSLCARDRIRGRLGIPSTVKHHLDALEAQGYLAREPGLPRALDLTDKARSELGIEAPAPSPIVRIEIPVSHVEEEGTAIPLVGRIAAGSPITAEQHVEDVFHLPTSMTGHGDLFMLEVSGQSMINAGIFDGDYVVIRSQNDARNGEFVAAMIDGEATVKELSITGGHVWLLPHNPDYSPIPGDEATILGKVVTVIRSL